MSRNLSGTAITAINSQETDKVFLTLLKLYDPATVPQFSPIYCVNDAYPVTSNSITYQPFPFKLRLPDDQVDGAIRQVQLQIDNIDRSITQVIRSTTNVPWVELRIIIAQTPNVVEVGPINFSLRQVKYNKTNVQGTLVYEDLTQLRFPDLDYNPFDFPGLFL